MTTKFGIKSASATTLVTMTQANGFHKLSILFYYNSGRAACASTIEFLDGWTPKLLVGLLLQE
jgi:hypothetical protein